MKLAKKNYKRAKRQMTFGLSMKVEFITHPIAHCYVQTADFLEIKRERNFLTKQVKGTHDAWSKELRIPLWGQGQLGQARPCSASSADAIVPKLKNPETPTPRSARALKEFAFDPAPS